MKSFKFKSDTKKVLNLVINSLYSNKDIFLRELISNASDAIDKMRLEGIKDSELLKTNDNWKIKIIPDKEKKILKIIDNGIGMTEKELEDYLGVIAESGTHAYLELLEKEKNQDNLIGKFGVGFYSSFIVSKEVHVKTRSFKSEQGFLWKSTGESEFLIEKIEKIDRGTEIILFLKEDALDYLEEYKLRDLIKKYSDYIEFPIAMDIEKIEWDKDKDNNPIKKGSKTVEEVLNQSKAIWLRNKEDITKEDYEEFYKHISQDFSAPLSYLHYKIEGATEFISLIYIPAKRPYHYMFKDQIKNNIHLYVKRVFILKESDLILPSYLQFISGVVDSADLSLNVSREILQENHILKLISKNLENKILSELKRIKQEDFTNYKDFYQNFGSFIKEGILSDSGNKEKLIDLLIYECDKDSTLDMIDLQTYVSKMPDDQKAIYYICGETIQEIKNSNYLESIQQKGYNILYSVDPIDEFVFQNVMKYKDKPIKSITKENLELTKSEDHKKIEEDYKDFLKYLEEMLNNKVKKVVVSNRLISSPVCLVVDDQSMGQYAQRFMKNYNKDFLGEQKRILEINANHILIQKLEKMYAEKKLEDIKEIVTILYDQALVGEGSKVSNPKQFMENISNLLIKVLN